MRKPLLYLFILFQPLFWWGCNSDIFVSSIPDLDTTLSLSGDNGSCMVTIPKKGLVGVMFDNDVDYSATSVFYNREEEIIPSSSTVDEVAKIRYGGQRFIVDFKIDGDRVEIIALDNAYESSIKVWVTLDYGYTTRIVTLEIGRGRPIEIVELSHDFLSQQVDSVTLRSMPQLFTNTSSQALKMTIYPYREVKSRISLTTEEDWTNGIQGTISLPTFVDGQWSDLYSEEVKVTIGESTYFTPSAVDVEEGVTVEVSPYSEGHVYLTVTFATLNTKYIATLRLPNSGETWITTGEWSQRQPVGYNLELVYQ